MGRRAPHLMSPENYSMGKETQLFWEQKCTYLQVVNVTTTGNPLEGVILLLIFFFLSLQKQNIYIIENQTLQNKIFPIFTTSLIIWSLYPS